MDLNSAIALTKPLMPMRCLRNASYFQVTSKVVVTNSWITLRKNIQPVNSRPAEAKTRYPNVLRRIGLGGSVSWWIVADRKWQWQHVVLCSRELHGDENGGNIAITAVLPRWAGCYRATLCVSAVFAVVRCPSVCLSVCPSRWCIVSRRLKISSNFFLGPLAPSF